MNESSGIKEAERMVLGSIMMGGGSVFSPLLPILGEDSRCFYYTIHREIYNSIVHLFKNSKPIDPLSVAIELKKESPGMISTIEKAIEETAYIRDTTPTIETAEYYASLVREYSQRRRLKGVGAEIQRLAEDENCAIDDLVANSSAKIISIAGTRESEEFDLETALSRLESETRDKMDGKGIDDRVFSGFAELDTITGGFVKGEVTIIAGRTGQGKSSLVQAFSLYFLQKEIPVIIFLLEMTEMQLLTRMISSTTTIPYTKIALGKLSKEEFEQLKRAKDNLANKPFYIHAKSANVRRMALLTQRFMHEQGRDCIAVIDYLQLIQASNPKASLYEQTSEIAVGIKTEIAVNLGIPVLAVSQLSRRSEYSSARASISDLRNSGMLEENAGLILLIHKPPEDAGFFEKIGDMRAVDIEVAKNRLGGTGEVTLGFEPEILKFSEF
jgi:replicative DNA helicase